MATVMTIEGARGRGKGRACKRVRMGRKRGCTIEVCRTSSGRWKFQKGTSRCGS